MLYEGLILLKHTTEEEGQLHHRSHLFTVRWQRDGPGDEADECRGSVRHVGSGESHDFADWPAFVALVLELASLR